MHIDAPDVIAFSIQVAAIGPTTAEALSNANVPVDVIASKPNAESLVQTITNHR